jgi:hypothetical protein
LLLVVVVEVAQLLLVLSVGLPELKNFFSIEKTTTPYPGWTRSHDPYFRAEAMPLNHSDRAC